MKREHNRLDHVVSTNINTNEVHGVVDNKLKFDISNSLDNNPAHDPLPIATISLRDGKNIDIP